MKDSLVAEDRVCFYSSACSNPREANQWPLANDFRDFLRIPWINTSRGVSDRKSFLSTSCLFFFRKSEVPQQARNSDVDWCKVTNLETTQASCWELNFSTSGFQVGLSIQIRKCRALTRKPFPFTPPPPPKRILSSWLEILSCPADTPNRALKVQRKTVHKWWLRFCSLNYFDWCSTII